MNSDGRALELLLELLPRFVRTRHELDELLAQLQRQIEATEPKDPREALQLASLKLRIVRKFLPQGGAR